MKCVDLNQCTNCNLVFLVILMTFHSSIFDHVVFTCYTSNVDDVDILLYIIILYIMMLYKYNGFKESQKYPEYVNVQFSFVTLFLARVTQ